MRIVTYNPATDKKTPCEIYPPLYRSLPITGLYVTILIFFKSRQGRKSTNIYIWDVFELIIQNPNLFRNIKILGLSFGKSITNLANIYSFLKFLYSNCNSISATKFQFQKNDVLIENHLSQFIIPQIPKYMQHYFIPN